MGRVARNVPTGKLYLRHPKNYDKSKLYSLKISYVLKSQPIERITPIKVRVDDFNPSANNGMGALKASYGNDYNRVNQYLYDTIKDFDNKIMEYDRKHPNRLNMEIIKSILDGGELTRDDEGKDFVEYVKENLLERYNQNKIKYSRYQNGLSGMNIFQQFLSATGKGTYKDNSIYLGEISYELIVSYINYRRNIKKNTTSTINHSLTPIIIACEKAWMKKYIRDDVYAEIKDCRIIEDASHIDGDGFDGKYLDKPMLRELLNFYENDTEPRRKEYIEMFLFAFHAGGMRMVDIMTLEWKHINFEKKELKKVLIKTMKYQKQRHTIPLTETAEQILLQWQKRGRCKRFVFDLIGDEVDVSNQENLYQIRNSVTKKVNQALAVVGEKMKLSFPLTFHTARHSFAINALNDDENPLDMYQVSRLLGHSSTEVTEKVYADYTKENMVEKLSSLNFNFLPKFDD